MRIITTREFRQEAKSFFELAENERVSVKRGKNKYVNLIVTDCPDKRIFSEDWLKEFFSIPAEYRVNPFEISPSGDLYFADKRNIDAIEAARKEMKQGKTIKYTPELRNDLFGDL